MLDSRIETPEYQTKEKSQMKYPVHFINTYLSKVFMKDIINRSIKLMMVICAVDSK